MNNNEERKSVASALRIFGWLIIWFGLIGGFVIANPSSYLGYGYDGIFLWPVAFGVWFGSTFSGALALGFAEVLDHLKDISHTLKSGSLNKGAINQPVDLVALANEKTYVEAKRMISYSKGKAQFLEIKEKLIPISDYKDVNQILITIENKIEQIDREVRQKEEKDFKQKLLEEERKQRQKVFWEKHSKKVLIYSSILLLVTVGVSYLINEKYRINSLNREIIETWTGEWKISTGYDRNNGFILNIEEEEVSFCNTSICGEPIKIVINDLDLEMIRFNIDNTEYKLVYMSKNRASYVKDGDSKLVVRTKYVVEN